MAEVLWVGFPCSRDCFLKFSVGERELGGPSFYQCLGRLGWICHTGHCSTTTVQDCCPAIVSGLSSGDCVSFVGGGLGVIVVVDIWTRGRAVLTAIGPSGVRRYRIRLLGGTDNQTHRPRRIGLCPCNMRHRQRGSARGQMQEFAAGKVHFLPPSRFTSLHPPVRAGEQRWRPP